MRQLSVPVRWAAVTAVIAASAGCMSVGDDDDGKPAPSRSAVPKGSAAEPDGATVAGTGPARTGGAEAHSERGEAAQSPSPTPSVSADPSDSPGTGPAESGRLRGGRLPAPRPSPSGPGVPEQPERPDPPAPADSQTPEPPEPDPEPSEPPPAPSASPAAQLRDDAMGAPDDVDQLRTPEASPQVGPA